MGHHSRKRIAFLLVSFTQMIMGEKRCLKTCKYFAIIYESQQHFSRLHFLHSFKKTKLLKTFLTLKSSEKRAAMMKKESKNVLYKEMDLVRLLSLYQSTAKGFL